VVPEKQMEEEKTLDELIKNKLAEIEIPGGE